MTLSALRPADNGDNCNLSNLFSWVCFINHSKLFLVNHNFHAPKSILLVWDCSWVNVAHNSRSRASRCLPERYERYSLTSVVRWRALTSVVRWGALFVDERWRALSVDERCALTSVVRWRALFVGEVVCTP